MTNNMTIFYVSLPILFGLLLLSVWRTDIRQQVIQNRLKAIKSGASAPPADLSISRIQRAASNSISFGKLLPYQLRIGLDGAFEAAGNRVGILHLMMAAIAAALVVNLFATWVLRLNPTLVLLLTITAGCLAPVIFLRIAQARYQNRFLDIFPDALDLIGRAVKAGLPVNEALVVAGQEMRDPVGLQLRRALEQVQLGMPMIEALERMANRVRVADFRFMVVALALQAKTGGSLAETLANLSGVIRGRKGLRLKIRGLTAEAKVSAMVLAALPFVVGGAMYVMNRDLAMPLFTDPRGRFMVGIAFSMLLSGLVMMYVMIKRAVR